MLKNQSKHNFIDVIKVYNFSLASASDASVALEENQRFAFAKTLIEKLNH